MRPTLSSAWSSAAGAHCATASASAVRASPGPAHYTITSKAEWLDWTPPQQMVQRQPYLLSAAFHRRRSQQSARRSRDVSRIHGTNQPGTIGRASSGCIRLVNETSSTCRPRAYRHQSDRAPGRAPSRRANLLRRQKGLDAKLIFGFCIWSPKCSPLREADAAERRDSCLTFPAPHPAYRRQPNGGRTMLHSYILGISGSPSLRFQETPCALE
jgi:hypothetical protein